MQESRLTFDVETSYAKHLGRKGSPFGETIGLCSIGWLMKGHAFDDRYLVTENDDGIRVGIRPKTRPWLESFPDLTGIDVLVGHNIKFDLLWYWRHPHLEAFLKRGGVIWDTLYAEYLLSGQFYNIHQLPHLRPSLENVAKRRGGTEKMDMVAALWESGVRTEDINQEILLEYQEYDVRATDDIYVSQLAQAKRQNQLHMIQGRMEGLLATTEMEYNGLHIDMRVAEKLMHKLEEDIYMMEQDLDKYVPSDLPDALTFNWGSTKHLSALLFGGLIKYIDKELSLDADGNAQFFLKKIKEVVTDADGNPVVYKSGKNAGKVKTRNVSVPDIERGPKVRNADFFYALPRQARPSSRWRCSEWHEETNDYYSTSAAVLEEVAESQSVELIKNLLTLRQKQKDLGTYYKRLHKGKWTGMLTLVGDDDIVHHNLNHAVAVTARLSSSGPNLQNLPTSGKSDVKKVFTSRFGADGVMIEGDYSQLEVVCKGVSSDDENLLQALLDKVCFHCDWLALSPAGEGKSYDEIRQLATVDHDPIWVAKRSAIKPLTFGEAYGAGPKSLAESTGMAIEDVEAAIEARKLKYPDMYKYDADAILKVQRSRKPSAIRTPAGYTAGIGYLRSATDTVYHFIETDNPEFMVKKGEYTSFAPTQIKNYPSQGLGGEIMQVSCGRVFRWLLANDRFQDRMLMVNTVHDCMWLDAHKDVAHHAAEAQEIMEDVCPYFNERYPNVNWNTPFPAPFESGPDMFSMEHMHFGEDSKWK